MPEKTVLMIANLDTRGAEFAEFKELVMSQGLGALIMDVSMELEPPFRGDITCQEVAAAGGLSMDEVRVQYTAQRHISTDCMVRGGSLLATALLEQEKVHGVFGAGGATATIIATSIMKALPFGVPKVMATPVAAIGCYVNHYVGTQDIAMVNTVVDVIGMNPMLRRGLANGVGAVCGMVRMFPGIQALRREQETGKPLIGVTCFGLSERSVERVLARLESVGFQPVAFHAQGKGDRAMDELIRKGVVQGAVDLVPRGLGEELLQGDGAAGPDRLSAAVEMGIPLVVAPGGFDQVSVGAQPEWRSRFGDRAFIVIDDARIEIRTSVEECVQIARLLAARINRAVAPVRVLVPVGGLSSLDRPGRALYGPEEDACLTRELTLDLVDGSIVEELPYNLYDPEFGDACADAFLDVWVRSGRALPRVGETGGVGHGSGSGEDGVC